jgi:hypothetical protein
MTGSIARIEARHLARSPLLWIGLVLVAYGGSWGLGWPSLAGDDLVAYQNGFLVSAGVVWAGAWLGLRDRASGAADLVAVTPTAPWRLWQARLAALAPVSAAMFALFFGAVLAVSAARGGRGIPDPRLLADGALAVVLGGLVGVAVGRLSGSRLVAVLAGAVWYLLCMIAADPGTPAHRLAPALLQQARQSVEFGFLPDPFWPHLAYLLGLVLLAGVLLLGLVARGSGQRPALAPVLAVVVAGLVLVGSGGARLVALPEALVPLGPDPADWKTVAEADKVLADSTYVYPDDGRATSCAGDATLTACVYPVYGTRLARHLHEAMRPLAGLLAGLPGAPARVRMVPYAGAVFCGDSEVQVGEETVQGTRSQPRQMVAGPYLTCALGYPDDSEPPEGSTVFASDSRDVVRLWALLATNTVTRQELQRGNGQDLWELGAFSERPSALVAPALAMADLPPDRVRAELAPLWERLRAGTLPVSELPGQRP